MPAGVLLMSVAVGLAQVADSRPATAPSRPSATAAGAVVKSGPAAASSGPSATSRPAAATQAARRPAKRLATMPALPEMPVVAARQVDALVAGLSGQRYQTRRDARAELQSLVNAPGVADMLKAHLKDAADPEVRAALEEVISGHDQPLAMIWCRSELDRSGPASTYVNQDRGYPWLFVRGDGVFVYDAACSFFAGQRSQNPVDFRQGTLNARQLWALKETIARSGQARQPSSYVQPPLTTSGMSVSLYVRSGASRRMTIESWSMDDVAAAAPDRKSSLHLGLAMRDMLADLPSVPYAGPYAARGQNIGKPVQSDQIAKLPAWTVAGVDFNTMFQAGGAQLDDKQLEQTRQVLAKTDTYKYQNVMAFQVFLIPCVGDARDLQYGR